MRGIRHHPLTQPFVVLATVVLACALTVVALRAIPHQARLERWLEKQPGVTSVWVTPGPQKDTSDWYSQASAGLSGELTPASFTRFSDAYETYTADHGWAVDWGMTVSHDRVTLPVSTDHGQNASMRELLALIVTDPNVFEVRFEDRYLFAVVVESADPAATTEHLTPALAKLTTVRVIRPGETLHP